MDEFTRAVEAAIFASAEPLTVDEIAAYVGDGEIEIALGQLSAIYEGRPGMLPPDMNNKDYWSVALDYEF